MAYLAASHCNNNDSTNAVFSPCLTCAISGDEVVCNEMYICARGAYATLPPIYNANSRQPQSFCHYGDDKPFFSL